MGSEAPVDLTARVAHFWSEWTDDNAPINERGMYRLAAEDFLSKFDVTEKAAR